MRTINKAALMLVMSACVSVSAQVAITTSSNIGDTLVGVGAGGGSLTVASAGTNYFLNPTTLAVTGSIANSGSVVDIGKTTDGLSTIELHANATFGIYTDSTRVLSYSGNLTAYAASTWGISDAFTVGAKVYVQIGYNPIASPSSYLIGIYNITDSTFDSGYNGVVGLPPTGLSVYLSTDYPNTDTYYYRQLASISGSTPLVYDYGTYYYGSGVGNFFSGYSVSDVTDVTTAGGLMYIVSSNGIVEYGTFSLLSSTGTSAVPEPSTYALLFGVAAMGLAYLRKRR